MKLALSLIFLIFLSGQVLCQSMTYTITANGHNIGDVSVKKSKTKDYMQIAVTSNVKVKLFITVDISYKLNATYKNNELINSAVTVYVKGKVHSQITTTKNGQFYTIVKNGHTSQYLHKITYSSSLLFVKEPKGVTTLYSDFGGSQKPLAQIGPHLYQLTNPSSGHTENYQYANGVLQKATIEHSLLTFELTKRE